MADDGVIDYVVVHELAHIREHNHSPRFWKVVEGILPDYRSRQKRLKLLRSSFRFRIGIDGSIILDFKRAEYGKKIFAILSRKLAIENRLFY